MSYANAPQAVVVDLAQPASNALAAQGDVLMSIEILEGSAFADLLRGDDSANTLIGLGGDDTLYGGCGDDWLTPGPGNDLVDGSHGHDMVSFVDSLAPVRVLLAEGLATGAGETDRLVSIEQVTGTVFADYIEGDRRDNRLRGLGDYDWFVGSEGSDLYEGGTGRDMVSYVRATGPVTVDLGQGRGLAGQALGDRYLDIERITGSVHAYLFFGSDGEDDFRGLGGYDWFVGSGGGKDRYDGGTGRDTVAYSASAGGISASLLLGRGLSGDAARDLYTAIENLTGSSHADVLTGDNGRNILRGLYGADHLIGNGGNDRLEGGGSNDTLDGGSGWDVAIFSEPRAAYAIAGDADHATVTRLAGGGDGQDLLFGIEALLFADGFVYL